MRYKRGAIRWNFFASIEKTRNRLHNYVWQTHSVVFTLVHMCMTRHFRFRSLVDSIVVAKILHKEESLFVLTSVEEIYWTWYDRWFSVEIIDNADVFFYLNIEETIDLLTKILISEAKYSKSYCIIIEISLFRTRCTQAWFARMTTNSFQWHWMIEWVILK
jgi:hypothetical protein